LRPTRIQVVQQITTLPALWEEENLVLRSPSYIRGQPHSEPASLFENSSDCDVPGKCANLQTLNPTSLHWLVLNAQQLMEMARKTLILSRRKGQSARIQRQQRRPQRCNPKWYWAKRNGFTVPWELTLDTNRMQLLYLIGTHLDAMLPS
jgi:hypothetical protein